MISCTVESFELRKATANAIAAAVSKPTLTMIHQFMAAEKPGRPAPSPFEILQWLRANMPHAAERVDHILYPGE